MPHTNMTMKLCFATLYRNVATNILKRVWGGCFIYGHCRLSQCLAGGGVREVTRLSWYVERNKLCWSNARENITFLHFCSFHPVFNPCGHSSQIADSWTVWIIIICHCHLFYCEGLYLTSHLSNTTEELFLDWLFEIKTHKEMKVKCEMSEARELKRVEKHKSSSLVIGGIYEVIYTSYSVPFLSRCIFKGLRSRSPVRMNERCARKQ